MNPNSWAILVPAHNSASTILTSIETLSEYFRKQSLTGEVVVVENGSTDDTWNVLNQIDDSYLPFNLIVSRSQKGLGNAIREGLQHVTADNVLITADDLPFGFSDLDYYRDNGLERSIALGSKAHGDSLSPRGILRKTMSKTFSVARRLLLQIEMGDTQGSILGPSETIASMAKTTLQEGYLISTEIVTLAVRSGLEVTEIPVSFRAETRKSNIRPLTDSLLMLKGLIEIRSSLGPTQSRNVRSH